MMNGVGMLTFVVRRMFSKKSIKPKISRNPKTSGNPETSGKSNIVNTPLVGMRGKIELTEDQEDMEIFDPEDLDEFESDFMNVHKSHKMHEWEMQKNKEHVKQQITTQKYFKEKEPRFLTFAEIELIRKLHETDPEEWTRERLSESFPALPHTIQKILSSKWLPKSVKKVMQYNNVAVENWKKFKTGKLAVNPVLNEHLMKFKDRKIILTDGELLAKQFVPPKLEFKKPRSQFFSSIIQTCSDERLLPQENNTNQILAISEHSDQVQNSSNTNIESNASFAIVKNSEKFTSDKKWNSALTSQENSEKYDLMHSKKKKNKNEPFTFNEFVKKKLEDIYKESPQEGATLLNVYRKQVEAAVSDDAKETAVSKDIQKPDKNDCATFENKNNMLNISIKENVLDTYIKIWNKKVDMELEYAKSIKIAKQLYKPGMTYRINDCYYDDDGEFLYRVPGVRS